MGTGSIGGARLIRSLWPGGEFQGTGTRDLSGRLDGERHLDGTGSVARRLPAGRGVRRDAGACRRGAEHYRALAEMLTRMPMDELQRRKQAADLSFLTQGITFTVYGREEGTERIFPYDLLPRIVTAAEWATIEAG